MIKPGSILSGLLHGQDHKAALKSKQLESRSKACTSLTSFLERSRLYRAAASVPLCVPRQIPRSFPSIPCK